MNFREIPPPVKGGTNQVHQANSSDSISMKFGGNISIYMISLNTNFYSEQLNITSFIEININLWKLI